MKTAESITIRRISDVRANNNVLWMKLLELALQHAPVDAKVALRQITANDREISELIERLAR